MKTVAPEPGLVITADTRFEPGTYRFPRGEGIKIAANDVVLDGNGAVLVAEMQSPELPDSGDWLYTPGDLGIARETHRLRSKRITLDDDGPLVVSYQYWGELDDPARLSVTFDQSIWTVLEPDLVEVVSGGWRTCVFRIDGRVPASEQHEIQILIAVSSEALDRTRPYFYDGFTLSSDAGTIWEGDARHHWDRWYNEGFSILRRDTKAFYDGVAVSSRGRSGVTIRNLEAHGFLTGLELIDCTGLSIENLDLGGNYHDPDYGWGEGVEAFGAMYLEGVTDSTIERVSAAKVWNGIVLRRCSRLTIERNALHHCSNTCLKLSQSSDNTVRDNDFSWGIRKYSEEVHARDSVSLLVESGSNDNVFLRNDFSHGGDGVFIRVLNGWCSTGNLFEENDCSFANNNAVEAWSPGNTYRCNKANSSSYGFWLGGSDDTVLIGNEVRYNGTTNRNAPEPFGNAGISVVHGSSTGLVVDGNLIEENSGPGISLAYRPEEPALNWLIVGNTIRRNRTDERGYAGHGLYLEYCRRVMVGGNSIAENDGSAFSIGRSCSDVSVDDRTRRVIHGSHIHHPHPIIGGDYVSFSLISREEQAPVFDTFSWDFGQGASLTTTDGTVSFKFDRPGRRRVCVLAKGAKDCAQATTMIYVNPRGKRVDEVADIGAWSLETEAVGGIESMPEEGPLSPHPARFIVRDGAVSTARLALASPLDLSGTDGLAFFYRYACELFAHTGKRNRTLRLSVTDPSGEHATRDFDVCPADGEDRYSWIYVACRWDEWDGASRIDEVSEVAFTIGPEEPADFEVAFDSIVAF